MYLLCVLHRRELNEECGLAAQDLVKVAVIEFEFLNSHPMLEVHVFKTHSYLGKPVETEGMCVCIIMYWYVTFCIVLLSYRGSTVVVGNTQGDKQTYHNNDKQVNTVQVL